MEENEHLARSVDMNKEEKLHLIRKTGLIAIIRAQSSDQLIVAADTIREGGIKVLEVTMTTPEALRVIETATDRFGEDVLFGAGTVLDAPTARAAILAGAGFVVAPTLNVEVISVCQRYSIPVVPGCYTPTEMLNAWEAGASMIKLFPADVGGPGLIKSILAPLPQLEIMPVGGVNLESAAGFIRSGAVALGVGGSLINQELIDSGDMDQLRCRAAAFVEQVSKAREEGQ